MRVYDSPLSTILFAVGSLLVNITLILLNGCQRGLKVLTKPCAMIFQQSSLLLSIWSIVWWERGGKHISGNTIGWDTDGSVPYYLNFIICVPLKTILLLTSLWGLGVHVFFSLDLSLSFHGEVIDVVSFLSLLEGYSFRHMRMDVMDPQSFGVFIYVFFLSVGDPPPLES